MTSLFDTWVRHRRNATEWAKIDGMMFLRHMAQNELHLAGEISNKSQEQGASLTVHARPAVASRFWYEIRWTGPDGTRLSADSQELDLALWRAAQFELQEEAKKEGRPHPGGGPQLGMTKAFAELVDQLAAFDDDTKIEDLRGNLRAIRKQCKDMMSDNQAPHPNA